MQTFLPCSYRTFLGFALASLVVVIPHTEASAQSRKQRRVRKHVATVELQPFSLDATSKHQVLAYNSPRAAQRFEPVERDNAEDDADSFPANENRAPHPTVPGKRAVLRNGIAYAPAAAPDAVKSAIWAANQIRTRPYVWGGGHGSFNDNGYDCSGTVSYALHHAGALGSPLGSGELSHYGERGRGRWITVYAKHGHTFAVIAGLRLDTTDFRYGGDVGPRWHLDGRDTRGYTARHPVGL